MSSAGRKEVALGEQAKARDGGGSKFSARYGRAEESKVDSTPAISIIQTARMRGSSIIIFSSRLARSMSASYPMDPIRHEQGTKSVRDRFRRISLTIQTKVRFRSKTLKVLKLNPSIKLPIAAEAALKKSTPDPLAVQNQARAMSLESNIVFDAPILCRCY